MRSAEARYGESGQLGQSRHGSLRMCRVCYAKLRFVEAAKVRQVMVAYIMAVWGMVWQSCYVTVGSVLVSPGDASQSWR